MDTGISGLQQSFLKMLQFNKQGHELDEYILNSELNSDWMKKFDLKDWILTKMRTLLFI